MYISVDFVGAGASNMVDVSDGPLYSELCVFSVLDEIHDAGQDESVFLAESLHFREAHHLGGVFFGDDLAQYAGPGSTR